MRNLSAKDWNSLKLRLSDELGVHDLIAEDIVNFLQKQPEFADVSAQWISETQYKDEKNLQNRLNAEEIRKQKI